MTFKDQFLRFWRSDNEKISLIRDILVALIAVFIVLLLLWSYTGQWFAAPMVAIESGSMEHDDEPFGRVGTINAGDMVLVKKVYSTENMITYGAAKKIGDLKYDYYGDWGDVIIYRPLGRDDVSQIIHRAMCWVDVKRNSTGTTYTIEAFDIYDQKTITIPELGLQNVRPSWIHSGYLTKGDNNNVIDQVSDICPQPVQVDWISGKARFEIPWIGTINLFFEDIIHGKNTVGNVHGDCLICLGIVIAILISIPIILDLYDYYKHKKREEF
jgi:signal peptidase